MAKHNFLIPIGVGAIIYSLLNLIVKSQISIPSHLSVKEKFDYIGQHISLIHSVEAIIMCIVSYIYSNGIDYIGDTDYLQVVTLAVSLGYFVYDFIYAEIYGLHDWPLRFHHIFVVIGGLTLLSQSEGGAIGPVCLFLTELSNPFLEMRHIMKGKKMEKTEAYRINQLLFAIVFILNR